MSCILIVRRLALVAGFVLLADLATAARGLAADPPPNPVPLAGAPKKLPPSCGGLPRGGRAYKDCIAAQTRRDATPDSQPTIKPAFSSR
jgi:hypothetical protein